MPTRVKRSKVIADLHRLPNAELSRDNLIGFFLEINELHNERGAALLLARALEDALAFAIISRLKIPSERFDDLFGYDRPAGSFDNKIRLAYAIGLIKGQTRKTIDIIKLIRNAFAHALNPISFDMIDIANACDLIEIPEPIPPTSPQPSENADSGVSPNRRKYQRACDVISHNLMVVAGAYVSLTRTRPPDSA